jgi:hypothetical protein
LEFEFDDAPDGGTGDPVLDDRTGEHLRRASSDHAPCRLFAAGRRQTPCPKGTPENPVQLSEQNELAFAYNRECKATNSFPDDPIVRWFAAIIEQVEREEEHRQQALLLATIRAKG